ncbi:MAG: GxxExxY protein [Patescibacteria group bacterium]
MELLYKDLSYRVVGLCIEIYNTYGSYHKEIVYHRLIKEKLDLNGIDNISEPKIDLYSQDSGKIPGCYVPDFLIDNKIILEIKATRVNCFRDEEQLIHYLKVSNYELGYLINFGLRSLYFKRLIYTNDKKKIHTKIR